jgi:hypothetical protein
LKIDDVVTQLIVLGLYGFKVLAQNLVISDLLLELLDIALLALTESSLRGICQQKMEQQSLERGAYLSRTILGCSLARAQLAFAIAFTTISIIFAAIALGTSSYSVVRVIW